MSETPTVTWQPASDDPTDGVKATVSNDGVELNFILGSCPKDPASKTEQELWMQEAHQRFLDMQQEGLHRDLFFVDVTYAPDKDE